MAKSISQIIPAIDVTYTGHGHSTVQDALDSLLRSPPTIASMTGGSINQKGQTITTVSIGWTLSGDAAIYSTLTDYLSFDANVTPNPYVFTGLTLTTEKTYTMTVGDGTANPSSTASQTVHFSQKLYYGNSANTTLISAQIVALQHSLSVTATADTRLHTLFMGGGGNYLYICYPTAYGAGAIWVNGLFDASFQSVGTVSVTNESGGIEDYYTYRSLYTQLGTGIPIEIK